MALGDAVAHRGLRRLEGQGALGPDGGHRPPRDVVVVDLGRVVARARHDHHAGLAGHEPAHHLVAPRLQARAPERRLEDGQEEGDRLGLLDDGVAQGGVVHAHGRFSGGRQEPRRADR